MNWYKIAKDFTERNVINYKIRFLSQMGENLDHLSKYVFQNGSHTKRIILSYISDKKVSSFPSLRDSLIEANEIVLDSPYRFDSICKDLVDRIGVQIKTLKREREDFLSSRNSSRAKKGWQ